MNFTSPFILPLAAITVPAISVSVGLLSVGALFALHHLRSQPPKRPTATLLFWQQAMRTPQTRVPWSRQFTHRRTFLLLASILLLWASAFTIDRWTATASRDIIVIDAGEDTAALGADHRPLLRDLADAAIANLRHTNQRPGLILAGPRPSMLVQPDQPAAITADALATLSPQQGASASSLALQAAGLVLGNTPGHIIWFTPATTLPVGLPDDIRQRIVLHEIAPPAAIAICGVTFVPAPDGSAHGTLHVHVVGVPATGTILRAKPKAGQAVESSVDMSENSGEVAFENWPADGQPLTLTLLNAPGAPSTHTVDYRVPDRRPPVFRFGIGTPAALKMALLTVGDEATDISNAKVILVASHGTAIPPDAVASIIVENDGRGVTAGTPLWFSDTPLVNGLSLEGAVAAEGPALPATGTQVLIAGSAAVASLNLSAPEPTLTLSSAIVNSEANLLRHAAFPVLMTRLCEALINRRDSPMVISRSRLASDPLWVGPPQTLSSGTTSVADPPLAATFTFSPAPDGGPSTMRWTMRFSEVVLAGATILLIVESLLYAARRIV